MSLSDHTGTNTRLPVIGLMGAPGSGKSTVAQMFAEAGCEVIDADVLAARAFEDECVRQTLRTWWGDDVIRGDTGDRRRVGEIVFHNPGQRSRLEGLIHPEVNRQRAEIRSRLFAHPGTAVLAIVEDCPLLLEVGLDGACDFVVLVDAPLDTRQGRVLATRGWSAEELQRREDSQAPLDTKRDRADYTIDNAQGLEATRRQVCSLLQKIIEQHRLGGR